MNRLKVENENAIKALARKGWSRRRVARELGLDRATVGRHWPEAPPNAALPTLGSEPGTASSNAAISTLGPEMVVEANAAISTAGSERGSPAGRRSHCHLFEKEIEAWCQARLSAQRIYQDLVSYYQFTGSYQSVKRFVRKLSAAAPLPFRRMECEPGDEGQVDFGQGAWIVDADGKKRRPHLFRLVLSHSRKGYSEVVWRQDTETFLRSLENAFRALGGAPRTLIVDNLRAAVSRSDWFDPELNPKLASFCEHYGTVILPTRPAMPRHKGKIEAGVKYAQNNALKGRQFQSLAEQNSFLSQWEKNVADTRIHGTIRQQVGQFFEAVERTSLLPLPASIFPVFSEAPRKVHRDGYVELEKAYYSVPPEYVGRQVWVRWEARLVRVYNQRMEQIALHSRSEPGKFNTDPNHIHDRKRCVIERGVEWLLDRARLIGKYSGTWAEEMIQQRGPQGLRVLHGLLSLAEEHPASELEKACHKAVEHGSWRLREIKELLAGFPRPTQSAFLEEHPLIRQLDAYANLIPVCFEPNPETESNP